MVRLEDAVIARLETHGEKFEVLVDPNLVQDVREGKEVDMMECLAIDKCSGTQKRVRRRRRKK